MDTVYNMKLYAEIFLLILSGYYLFPAGLTYLFFYRLKNKQWSGRHIQKHYPTRKSIMHEIRWSLISILIFSFLTLLLYHWVRLGNTKMYFSVKQHGGWWLAASSLLIIVLYDTYFYWIHRFMHLKRVFPWVHKIHHQSHTPTPWAILSFGPLEAILEFAIYPLLLFIIPLHPVALGIFILYNIVLNTGGHIGYEIVPRSFFNHPLLKYGLTVSHHDMHHSKINCNYGVYFNIWDRLMNTNHPDYEKNFYQKDGKQVNV